MASIRRSLLAVSAVLLLGSAPVFAQAPEVTYDTVKDNVQTLCGVADKFRDGGSEQDGLVWSVHVAPMECSAEEWVVYVRIGSKKVDSRDLPGEGLDVGESYAGGICAAARDFLVYTVDPLARSASGGAAAAALAKAVAAQLDEFGLGAFPPGVEVALPALPDAPLDPTAELDGGAPVPALPAPSAPSLPDPGLEDLARAGVAVDAGTLTVDDLALDSEGTAVPDPQGGVPLYRVEGRNSAGGATVDAAVDPAPIGRLIEADSETSGAPSRGVPVTKAALAGPAARAALPSPLGAPRVAPTPAAGPAPPPVVADAEAPVSPASVRSPERVEASAPARALVGAAVGTGVALLLAAAALYHRLGGREIRSGGPRTRILDLLASEPGLLATHVARRLGLHRTTAEYHLRMLGEAGAVASRPSGGRTAYFLPGDLASPTPPRNVLCAAGVRRVLDLARASPGATIGEIATAAGVDVPSASRHVRRLREARLVEVRSDGRFRRVFAIA